MYAQITLSVTKFVLFIVNRKQKKEEENKNKRESHTKKQSNHTITHTEKPPGRALTSRLAQIAKLRLQRQSWSHRRSQQRPRQQKTRANFAAHIRYYRLYYQRSAPFHLPHPRSVPPSPRPFPSRFFRAPLCHITVTVNMG